ncbi:hypothetical protein P3567_23705, partial [Vibrio parahaemolyticus]|nr:hypothetical protein [Vibrio parahaemolyticus]
TLLKGILSKNVFLTFRSKKHPKQQKVSIATSQQSFDLNSHSLNQRVTLVTSKLGSNDSKLTA